MIKNIAFDFGGVLFDLHTDCAIERFTQIGLPDAAQRLDHFQQRGVFAEFETGKIDIDTLQHKLEDICGKPLTIEEISWAWMGYVGNVDERKMLYIQELRQQGYKVYLLSNNNPIVMGWSHTPDYCSLHLPIDAFVEKIYVSYEIGVLKPDARIFTYMLNDAHIKAEETLFVDDGPANIVAAKKLGFQTLQVDNNAYWVPVLSEMLKNQ